MANKLHSFHKFHFSRIYLSGPEMAPSGAEKGQDVEAFAEKWIDNPDLGMEDITKDLDTLSEAQLQELSALLTQKIKAVEENVDGAKAEDLKQMQALKKNIILFSLEEWVKSSPSQPIDTFVATMKDLSAEDLEEISRAVMDLKRQMPYAPYGAPQAEVEGASSDRSRVRDLEESLRTLQFQKKLEEDPAKGNELLLEYLKQEEVDYNEGAPDNYWEMLPQYAKVVEAAGIPLDKKQLNPAAKSGLASMLDTNWEGATECAISRFLAAESVGLVTGAEFRSLAERSFRDRTKDLVSILKEPSSPSFMGDKYDWGAIILSKDLGRMERINLGVDGKVIAAELANNLVAYIEGSKLPVATIRQKVRAFVKVYGEITFKHGELPVSKIEAALAKKGA